MTEQGPTNQPTARSDPLQTTRYRTTTTGTGARRNTF